MSNVAKELRELANKIEQVAHESSVSSIAWEQIRALCDYLCLRARVIEIEASRRGRCLMTIGDDLQVLLGLVPIRDRAGIQRGTMATEAARASDGNAEGQALTRQGFDFARAAPPPVQVPPGMGGAPEPDAANMPVAGGAPAQFVIPGSTGGPSAAPTPAPRERVVAASPAAAPSPEVKRYSDIMLEHLEQQKRQAKMQQLFNGLGLLANGLFNRDADSSNATQRALSSGGGGGGGGDIGTLKTLLEMRGKEDETIRARANEENAIDTLMRLHGWDYHRAKAHVDSGKAGEGLTTEVTQRAAARESETLKSRLLEDVPRYAKILGEDENSVRARIINDPNEFTKSLSPKVIADVEKDRATTTQIGVDTRQKKADIVGIEEAQGSPAAVAERYRKMGYTWVTEDTIKSAAANTPTWTEFNKNHQPLSTDTQQDLAIENRMRKERGLPELTPSEFKKAGQQPHIEDTAGKVGAAGMTKAVTEYIDKEIPAKRAIAENISGSNAEAQDRWRSDIITGGGPISKVHESALRTAGHLLGIPQERVANSQMLFNHMTGEALKMRKELLPGAMSDSDRIFLAELGTGNREWSADTVQRFLIIQEKYQAAQLWRKNEETRRLKAEKPVEYQGASIIPMPPPNRFLRESLESRKGQEALNTLHEDPSPKNKRIFDEMYGKGRADYFLSGGH